MKDFHKTAGFFIFLFLGVILVSTVIALSRKSGNTHMDMAKIHLLRSKINESSHP